MGFIAREMGAAAVLGPWTPEAVFAEIRRTVPGYDVSMPALAAGGAAQTVAINGRMAVDLPPGQIRSDRNGLFASGTLGRYSKVLNSVVENRLSR
jgi:NADH-quinone oxidoreductase subunit G